MIVWGRVLPTTGTFSVNIHRRRGSNCHNLQQVRIRFVLMKTAIADSLGRVHYFISRKIKMDSRNLFLTEVHAKEILSPHLSDSHRLWEDKLSIWIITKSYSCLADHRNCLSRVSLCYFGTFL